jgi:uncharacterized protein (TIGR02996 family)
MQLRDAFLEDVLARPEDPAVKLVFADWLEENGQQERGEFIRVQCGPAQLEWAVRSSGLLERAARAARLSVFRTASGERWRLRAARANAKLTAAAGTDSQGSASRGRT